MKRPTDQELSDWVAQVYRETHPMLLRFAKVLIKRKCPQMAPELEDLVNDTYFVLLRKCREIFFHENVAGWLVVALKFNFSNRRKKIYRRLKRERLVDLEAQSNIADAHSFFDEVLQTGGPEMLQLLKTIIQDENKYRAFVDFHLNHVSIRDLAERYGKSENAMKVQLHRTRIICRSFIENNNIILMIIFMLRVTFKELWT